MSIVKVKTFNYDPNFLFLIQKLTNESSKDILSYFLDLARILSEDTFDNSKAYRPNKKALASYKNTDIPFSIEVWSHRAGGRGGHTEGDFTVSINFPRKKHVLDGDKMESVLTEISLGLTDYAIPDFSKPATRIPKSLRKINIKR